MSGMQAAAAASAAGVASGSSHFQQEMQAAGQPQPPTVTPFSFQDPESQVGVFASVFFALALLKNLVRPIQSVLLRSFGPLTSDLLPLFI